MFAKTAKPQSFPAPPATAQAAQIPASRVSVTEPSRDAAPGQRVHPVVASVIGPDLIMEGAIVGDVELHVEGAVRGDIHVTRLVVGENAHVEGRIRAQWVEVRGRVIGDIEGQKVILSETAYVMGDILHERLSIEPGAYFQGLCRQPPVAPPVAASPAPSMAAPAQQQQAQMPCGWDKAS